MPVLNAKGKPFTWSYSALKDFLTCPRKYAANRFHCTAKFEMNAAAAEGDTIHKALEKRLRFKTPLPSHISSFDKYCRVIERKEKEGWKISVEEELAFDRHFRKVDWFSKDAWARCKLDVGLIRGNAATTIDWKTGKKREDLFQMRLFSAFMHKVHPHVTDFESRLVWLATGEVTPLSMGVPEVNDTWVETLDLIHEIEECWRTDTWITKESGLCKKYCNDLTCHLNGRR